jgi:hypothetical protein
MGRLPLFNVASPGVWWQGHDREGEAKNHQPVEELIVRDDVQGEDLLQARAERPGVQSVVEIVRNVMEVIRWKAPFGCARDFRERQSAGREDSVNTIGIWLC